ncbi:MAG: phosphoglycerate dehydrogenase [Gammaproteobacteria bacterium]|nr:phosphoglycerate dehydrogenase [Gammaproteobacteria bacterium]
MQRFKILTLNDISPAGLARLPRDRYEIAGGVSEPDAILVRSADMHATEIPDSVKAIGRAGAGVNNIPVEALSRRGVPVFNAPGANANAVKELVVAGMFLAARNICQAWDYVRRLEGADDALAGAVEAGKKRFVGFELPGRTLGVVGLGAIGVEVANAALALGMRVVGFDPQITVQRAWQLSSGVEQAPSLEALFARADLVTLHVPLVDATQRLVDAKRLTRLRKGAVLLNFARDGIVDLDAVAAALDSGQLGSYVCDFPDRRLKDHPRVIALPHLGASTHEAEQNCAMMVVENVREYLENGNIRHSVNFPETQMPRNEGHRVAIANANVPNMVGQISTAMADAGLNIADLINKSRGEVAYTLVDLDLPLPEATLERIRDIHGVLSVRTLRSSEPAESRIA